MVLGKADGGNRVTGDVGSTLKGTDGYAVNIGFKPNYIVCFTTRGGGATDDATIYYNGTFYYYGTDAKNGSLRVASVTNTGFTINQRYEYDGFHFIYVATT